MKTWRSRKPDTRRPNRCGSERPRAFTLLELLVVIAIIGILAAVVAPSFHAFKPNVTAAAAQQLLTDVARARQLAMSQRTTVYMVFVPPSFWTDPAYNDTVWTNSDKDLALRLLEKQQVGYNFVTLSSLGDQPGRHYPHYLGAWKTLPEGVFIPKEKFLRRDVTTSPPLLTVYSNSIPFLIRGFNIATNIPFPSEITPPASGGQPYVALPYIAFNYLGQLTSIEAAGQPIGPNELIPLGKGSVLFGRDAAKTPTKNLPSIREDPPGNLTNSAFTLVNVEWVTGRARINRQEVQ